MTPSRMRLLALLFSVVCLWTVQPTVAQAEQTRTLVLTPHKLGPLKLGMRWQRAVETGLVVKDPYRLCGDPAQVSPAWGGKFFVEWRRGKVREVFVRKKAIRTKSGVRVGSTVQDLQLREPLLQAPVLVEGDGGPLWVQARQDGRDWLIFLLDADPAGPPQATDQVSGYLARRGWNPANGLHGGC